MILTTADLSNRGDEENEPRMKKPHKSRRKKRPDLDEYYWPQCKNRVSHLPEHFKLTQV